MVRAHPRCSSGSSNGNYVLSCSLIVAFDRGAVLQLNPLLWDTCFWQVLGQVLLNQSLLYISLFFTGKKLLFVLFPALWVVWLSDMNVKRERVSLTMYVEVSYMGVFTLHSSTCPFCMLHFSLLLFLLQVGVCKHIPFTGVRGTVSQVSGDWCLTSTGI